MPRCMSPNVDLLAPLPIMVLGALKFVSLQGSRNRHWKTHFAPINSIWVLSPPSSTLATPGVYTAYVVKKKKIHQHSQAATLRGAQGALAAHRTLWGPILFLG